MYVLIPGLSLVIIAATAIYTLARYRYLPEAIPTFSRSGSFDGYRPRAAIWIVPAIQPCFLAVMFASAYAVDSDGLDVFALGLLGVASGGWFQYQSIAAAIDGRKRISMWPLWLAGAVFVVLFAIAVIALRSGR
jgi:Protein of unknown function (DUF1648)